MTRHFPVLLFALLALLSVLLSCDAGLFQRTGTVELSFIVPEDAEASPAGLVSAVLDSLSAEARSRLFNPATAIIEATVSADDIEFPISVSAPYESGPIRMRIQVPVGRNRLITVTAYNGAKAALTQGQASLDIVRGITSVSLNMVPLAATLLESNRITLGPDVGLSVNTVGTGLAGLQLYWAELPVTGTYLIRARTSVGDSIPCRVYGNDGARLNIDSGMETPDRFTAPLGKLYVSADLPASTVVNFTLDVDWRAKVVSLNAENIQDSRDAFIAEFPHSLSGANPVVSFFGANSGVAASVSNKRLILSLPPPQGSLGSEWIMDPVPAPSPAVPVGTFTDPILNSHTRDLANLVPAVPVRRVVYASPTGNDDNLGRPDTPVRSPGRALQIATLSSCYNSTIVLAAGDYDQPTRIETNNQTNWRGGWTPFDSAPWQPSASAFSTIRMGGNDAYEPFVVWNFATIEGIVFKHHRVDTEDIGAEGHYPTVVLNGSDITSPTVFTRCRFYSTGLTYPQTNDQTMNSSAILVSNANGLTMNRCSVNWPEDQDPLTMGGLIDQRATGSSFSGYVEQMGIEFNSGHLDAFNSIVAAGRLDYSPLASLSVSSIEMRAVSIGYGASSIVLFGNTLINGSAPDSADYSYKANRHIVSSGSSLTAVNNVFLSEASLPPSADDGIIWGISYTATASTVEVDYNAFVGLGTGSPFFASNYALTAAHNRFATASFNRSSLLPTGGSILDIEGFTPTDYQPEIAFDFYLVPRAPSWSVGAVEYR